MSSMYGDLDRPPLNRAALRRALLTPGSLWTSLEVLSEAASTNAVLADLAARDGESGRVVIAEHQTAGRGRLGRVWTAPARSGLTLSALVRPHDVAVARWSWLPLLAGLAVAAALRSEAQVQAGLKWPNDVMIDGRKVAGMLVERVENPRHGPAAVIGIGLNVSLRGDELPVPQATSLALAGAATTDRTVLARAILRTLEGLFTDWQRWGGDAQHGLQSAYVDACATLGQQVSVTMPSGEIHEGKAVGVDASGRLLVRTQHRQVALGAGDVVHVQAQES
ncbi:MAG: biotin--[acetyl-CoA-carboxylase] ligase [Propionibacteriales bacterium]|nr:biotin--[acetyl-CoA-carboxylase] ligase [Propionibacteriales bacterium]